MASWGAVLANSLHSGMMRAHSVGHLLLPWHTLQCTEPSLMYPAGGAAVHRARDGAAPRHDLDGVDAGGARDAAARQPGGARGLLPAAVRCLGWVAARRKGEGEIGHAAGLAAPFGVGRMSQPSWLAHFCSCMTSAPCACIFTTCLPAVCRAGDCARRCGAAAACNPLCVATVQDELSPKRSAAVLQQQHLFSVYVHARAAYKDYPEGSVFQGRLIPDRAVRAFFLLG